MKAEVNNFPTVILNDNARGLCSEVTCGEKYTHYYAMVLMGIRFFLPVCEKHVEIIDEKRLENNIHGVRNLDELWKKAENEIS